MPKKSVYIAGPITNVEQYWRAFEEADNQLTAQGCAVISPARLPLGLSNAQYARINMATIDAVDAALFLPGWQFSRGAELEFKYCAYIEKPVFFSIEKLIKGVETWTES